MKQGLTLHAAPVQGHTDAAWRHFHHDVYGGDQLYYTPFIRAEHGDLRQRDLRDFTGELSEGIPVEPQVIFRDEAELTLLLDRLIAEGTTKINLNMGCPFPLQMGKGRGCGFLSNKEQLARIPEILASRPDASYSLKMRLGMDDAEEWKNAIEALKDVPFRFVAIHPRIGRQQYGGELMMDQFEELLKVSPWPVVFNGELRTPEDMQCAAERYPEIAGLMVGRGLLGRPSLFAEFSEGQEWSREQRLETMLKFHRRLLNHYEETLCGDSQLLSKIKPFWEYAEEEIGRKPWKAIKKATTLPKYRSAVAMIEY